jgi:hypothetical protein
MDLCVTSGLRLPGGLVCLLLLLVRSYEFLLVLVPMPSRCSAFASLAWCRLRLNHAGRSWRGWVEVLAGALTIHDEIQAKKTIGLALWAEGARAIQEWSVTLR